MTDVDNSGESTVGTYRISCSQHGSLGGGNSKEQAEQLASRHCRIFACPRYSLTVEVEREKREKTPSVGWATSWVKTAQIGSDDDDE